MSNLVYHGYWFWSLRDNTIFQSKDLTDEYCILHCPQEYEGPFKTAEAAYKYRTLNPTLSQDFNKSIKEMEEFYFGNYND